MPGYHLLRKTELRIERIALRGANLNELAATVAETLGLDGNKVLVVDVRDDTVVVDVLQDGIDPAAIVGKRDLLLRRLAALPGVGVTARTAISSAGLLGWIALDEGQARAALERSQQMAEEIRKRVSRRAIVFSTGSEVAGGQIQDTNTPTIARRLEGEGYSVTRGATLSDDAAAIAGRLGQAVYDDGYGLVITTGGVGAEDKDCTIEALLLLDPGAATPYLCRFEKGTGRHRKDGIRIGVAQASESLIVALPGPNDEVSASLEALVGGLAAGLGKEELAEQIAENLRRRLRGQPGAAHHGVQPDERE